MSESKNNSRSSLSKLDSNRKNTIRPSTAPTRYIELIDNKFRSSSVTPRPSSATPRPYSARPSSVKSVEDKLDSYSRPSSVTPRPSSFKSVEDKLFSNTIQSLVKSLKDKLTINTNQTKPSSRTSRPSLKRTNAMSSVTRKELSNKYALNDDI
jgi:hypothetical protein